MYTIAIVLNWMYRHYNGGSKLFHPFYFSTKLQVYYFKIPDLSYSRIEWLYNWLRHREAFTAYKHFEEQATSSFVMHGEYDDNSILYHNFIYDDFWNRDDPVSFTAPYVFIYHAQPTSKKEHVVTVYKYSNKRKDYTMISDSTFEATAHRFSENFNTSLDDAMFCISLHPDWNFSDWAIYLQKHSIQKIIRDNLGMWKK